MKKTVVFAFCLLLMSSPALAYQTLPGFADLAEKLLPSVVNISTQNLTASEDNDFSTVENSIPNLADYLKKPKQNKTSLGSGFILDENGYIATNNHVIENASEITVILSDNRNFPAEVVGRDLKTDLALLKINCEEKLPPVKLGNADKIRVGDWILTIGNPFGLGGSVTSGIVSAKSRDIDAGPYDSFIQTDASINQGCSGGPMFNLDGEVVGINTAIFSTNGGSMGLGFAIPINMADYVLKELKNKGKVERGWIGVKIQSLTPEIRHALGVSQNIGVIVSEVEENSPAEKSGVEVGDVITDFGNQKIDDSKNLSRIVAETTIGEKTFLKVLRQKKSVKLPITVQKLEEKQVKILPSAIWQEEKPEIPFFNKSGLALIKIDENIQKKYQISASKGILIAKVESGSEAEAKGLKAGNIINQIDNKDVLDLPDVEEAIKEARLDNNRPILLQINDKGIFYFVALKVAAHE